MTDSGPISGFTAALRAVLTLTALATAAIGAWLVLVVATVLPARDPAHVPLWSAVAAGSFVYSARTLLVARGGPRPALLRAAALLLSLGAAVSGLTMAGSTMAAPPGAGRHFEGYLLVMGAAFAAHGLCALAYLARTAASARPVRPS